MKKRTQVMLALGLLLVGVVCVMAFTYTNQMGQIVTVTVGDNGVETSTYTLPNALTPATRTFGNLPGFQLYTNVNVMLPATTNSFTPRDIGDLLIGTYSGKVQIAYGTTAGYWTPLN